MRAVRSVINAAGLLKQAFPDMNVILKYHFNIEIYIGRTTYA
jgi:hypothetical protein